MAYYTDVIDYVVWNTNIQITSAAVSNVVADMLVAHAGLTLVRYATEGVESGSDNYAEVSWNGLNIMLYNNYTSAAKVIPSLCYAGKGSLEINTLVGFEVVSGVYIVVKLRFYNVANGFYVGAGNNNVPICIGYKLKSIGDQSEVHGLSITTRDGLRIITDNGYLDPYYIPSTSGYCGPEDADGIVQILTPLMIGTGSTKNPRRYICLDCYTAPAFLLTGMVMISGRAFVIKGVLAYRLNP